ncbi:efflux RND transporter permease subunit [Pseudohaliea rubra]|uniref:RND multidrug efflux transporter, Acriflavin resistance protein n=1 Tax=Pseudohaliea rubra DSM 19751 TaxID=1265313 RepID=A0A095VS30_9GAMM|nr:efflux RND transporter permease subunit [Pseudohaliea rubra]KGE04165.1 RND multidrug efflux transporter, Acriflavin resistance protein [Pseudohaliea rubra DSM 19751]
MIGFIDAAISRTRSTLLVMAMVVLVGLIARAILPIANEPHIEAPFFYVGVLHEGISPEDAERLLIQPMEIELRKIEGIEEITALASEGNATVFVEFAAEMDLDEALSDLREAVDRAKAELPGTAEEPMVRELQINDFPMIQVSLIGDGVPERDVYAAATMLREALETIPDVLKAELRGEREEMLEVLIDPEALENYAISSEELINTLQRNNRLIPAGSLDSGGGRFSVKVPSVVEEPADVMSLPVRNDGTTVVTLGEIATIRKTFKDRTGHARVNGREAITVAVTPRANGNIIEGVAGVRAVIDEFRPRIPEAIELLVTQDQAEFAALQVTELQGNIFTALALVMVLVVATMGFRSGLIVGFGIPVSLLFSVTIIYLLGFTFNFMVMFGMLLGLGMLIDGAIVVTEYADRRMGEGIDHRAAYSEAVKRMFWPVTASTATTLAAFLPLMFWPGISGKFMSYLPITVFTVLAGSLLYALLFGPVLGTVFGRPTRHSAAAAAQMHELETGDPTKLRTFTGRYARFLAAVTRRPTVTLGLILAVLLSIFWSYGRFGVGMVFFSDSDPQFIQVSVRGRGNFSAEEVDRLVWQVEERILQIEGIRAVNARTILPGANGIGRGADATADRIGSIFVELHPEQDRASNGAEIFREIRARTSGFPGIIVEVFGQEMGPPVGKPIQIELRSRQRELLEPAIARIRAHLDTLPELVDIDDTRALPSIEWRMEVDRAEASLYGADVVAAGVAVQLVTNGVKVAEYRPDSSEDAVDIRVRYPPQYRGVEAMRSLRLSTPQGRVPLSNFVTMQPRQGVDTLERIDGMPVERIRADVIDGVLADTMVDRIGKWLQTQTFDPALQISFRGANEEQNESIAFVQVAFLLSLLLMFVLLVTQFNSFYQSTLILLAVIMSTAGVLLGLLILGNPFSAILSGVGVVALAGIVVNNNIVLIDTFNYVREQHPELPVQEIIVRSAAQRLRPVLLTTVTTVFGLLPLACGLSVDLINRSVTASGQMSTFWGPLSQAIVFGLTFATVLTLVATPAMLALPARLRQLLGRFRRSDSSAAVVH